MSLSRRQFLMGATAVAAVAALPAAAPVPLIKGEAGQYWGVRFVWSGPLQAEANDLACLRLSQVKAAMAMLRENDANSPNGFYLATAHPSTARALGDVVYAA